MKRYRSSVDLPRIGSPSAPRVLRLRDDGRLGEFLQAAEVGDSGRLHIPSRERVARGERVRVEISFGPLADEVVLDGTVATVLEPIGTKPPTVVIRLSPAEGGRVSYIREILAGDRPASARTHRRVQLDLPVRWRSSTGQYRSRITDLSRGGAFILSQDLPHIGARVELEIDTGADPLQFSSVVSWIRSGVGFGVHFKLADRAMAEQLTAVVRRREAELVG